MKVGPMYELRMLQLNSIACDTGNFLEWNHQQNLITSYIFFLINDKMSAFDSLQKMNLKYFFRGDVQCVTHLNLSLLFIF